MCCAGGFSLSLSAFDAALGNYITFVWERDVFYATSLGWLLN
jgi:hypothetical protein